MCLAVVSKHPICGHQWLQLQQSCAPDKNLLSCQLFQPQAITVMRSLPAFATVTATSTNLCPQCNLYGNYDKTQTRLIRARRTGIRIGTGPSPVYHAGFDCPCAVM